MKTTVSLYFDLELLEQIENLRLNRHVQRSGGFVADEDLRVAGHGNGDDHALSHAAGELVWILRSALRGPSMPTSRRYSSASLAAALPLQPPDAGSTAS